MCELPRHKAIDSLVMSEASAEPGSDEVAAAQTAEKLRNQRRERSSQTPMDVTASGINLNSDTPESTANSDAYFVSFPSNALKNR